MEIFLLWFTFAVICGVAASSRGRSGFGYFLLAMIITPLLCFLLIIAIGKTKQAENQNAPTPETHVKCPDCRELVLRDANKCKHCGCTLIPQ